MSERTWHSGPPPHVGWWNASNTRNPNIWRWWDGKNWSFGFRPHHLVEHADCSKVAPHYYPIEWTDHWPSNARVPRIAP